MPSSTTTAPKKAASTDPNSSGGANISLRRFVLAGLFTLAALFVLISLGNWQVRRLAWKEDLIATVAERPSAPPLNLDAKRFAEISDAQSILAVDEYRDATLTGRYAPEGEVLAFTSLEEPKGPLGGPGYWVMTPFRIQSSSVLVYINRGFVPAEKKSDYSPPPSGEVAISGLIRAPEAGSWFTPDPDLGNHVFYARDIKRIAAATGIGDAVGFYIDLPASATPPSGLPQGGETRMTFPNDHLQYAITWYGLAAALAVIFGTFAWRTFRAATRSALDAGG